MKQFITNIFSLLTSPFTVLSSIWLRVIMALGKNEISNAIFMKLGILPVLDHYYQPMINPKRHLTKSLRDDRELPGIDFNIDEQLNLLAKFDYSEELVNFPRKKIKDFEYYYENDSFESGDGEYLYNIIRHFKPKRIIEIGSGNSTLMAKNAIKTNKLENSTYTCQHICIEPYEQSWLEKIDVEVIREKAECLNKLFFSKLESNDILFIDSSHIIRPQGDILFEYLELLPTLKSGVIVHVHDIFTPKDYPNEWIYSHRLWNEQYLLESFLTFNSEFKIIGALNYLIHNYREEFNKKCPVFAEYNNREAGSFWIAKK